LFDASQSVDVRDNFPGGLNTAHDDIYDNMRRNIKRQLPQVKPHELNDYKAMLLCGGPSLNDHVSEIKRKRRQGWKLITVNGTHDWALDHGMVPSMFALVDARPFNVRFVQRAHKDCRYMIASQAHPDVFDALEGQDVHIWHGGAELAKEKRLLTKYYNGRWATLPGGTSIGTRAIGLASWLGIRKLEVYGFDCCYRKKAHHAYEQTENDYKTLPWSVKVGRRKFVCDPWMVKQCDEMCQFAAVIPSDFKMIFKGDGMMSYLVRELAAGRNPKRRIL
jgi:uncharacterized Rossmann fold enzyme